MILASIACWLQIAVSLLLRYNESLHQRSFVNYRFSHCRIIYCGVSVSIVTLQNVPSCLVVCVLTDCCLVRLSFTGLPLCWDIGSSDCGLLVYQSVEFLFCPNQKHMNQEHIYWSAHESNTIYEKSIVIFFQKT